MRSWQKREETGTDEKASPSVALRPVLTTGQGCSQVKARNQRLQTRTFPPYTPSSGFTEPRVPSPQPRPGGRNGARKKEYWGQARVGRACRPRRQHPGNGACALQASETRFLQSQLPEGGGNGLRLTGEGGWMWHQSTPNTAPPPSLRESFLAPETRAVSNVKRKWGKE